MTVTSEKIVRTETQLAEHTPMRIVEIELEHPLPTISAFDEKTKRQYKRAYCLVRLHTKPLGVVELNIPNDSLAPDEYVEVIWDVLHVQINEHLQQDGLPQITELTVNGLAVSKTPSCIHEREQFLSDAPFVSVIVPTHERPEQLTKCLRSLMTLHYPHYDIIVVDNAPETNVTADLVKELDPGASFIHYVREDNQGPSWARNRGIMVAKSKILAFADDDVIVDSHWLAELVKGFTVDESVVCVTGLVLPLELETPAQFLFEEAGKGFNRGYIRTIFSWKENPQRLPMHPYIAVRYGTGASMAFTSAFIRSVGGFDPALGRKGPVKCSQDIALFFRVIASGYKIAYEPASLLYHLHRRDYNSLRKQTYNYGVGFTATLTKSLLDNPQLIFDFVVKLPYGLFSFVRSQLSQREKSSADYPKELNLLRRKGMLYGPLAYLRSRWQVRNVPKKLFTLNETQALHSVER